MVQVRRKVKDYLVSNPFCGQGYHPPDQAKGPSNLTLNASRDGAPTASLGSLCQCLTTLWVNNFFLTAYLNLPSTQYHSAARGTLIYPQDPAGDADFGKPWDLQLAGLRAQGGQTQPSVTPALLQRCVQARF